MGWPVFSLGALVVLLIALWLYLRYFEWKEIFHPLKGLRATPADAGLDYEDVDFVAEDGARLRGWWIPKDPARGTLLYCGGHAGNLGTRIGIAEALRRLDVNVFLFDYRGYGESRGFPTERGLYRDARAAYEVIRARYADAEQPPVMVYGNSLGAAVAVQLALDKPVKGLVLQSAFTSVLELGAYLHPGLPIRLFSRFHFDSLTKISRVTAPKLVAHSETDQRVPVALGRRLFEAAAEPKEYAPLAGPHGEPGWVSTPAYWPALERFVDRALGPRPTPAQ